MNKYYLYDIQNDERVLEVSPLTYENLEGGIFNYETILFMLMIGSRLEEVISHEEMETMLAILKKDNERIYKVIEIEVDTQANLMV